jgi:AAA domain
MQNSRPNLVQRVCKWPPADLPAIAAALAANGPSPARTFSAYDEYASYFEPLILAEVAAELTAYLEVLQSRGTRDNPVPHPRRVSVARAVAEQGGGVVDVDPVGGIGSRPQPLPYFDGDVVILWEAPPGSPTNDQHLQAGLGPVPPGAALAIVRHKLSRHGGARLFLNSWPTDGREDKPKPTLDITGGDINADLNELRSQAQAQAQRIKQADNGQTRDWLMISLGSIVTMRREHDAILNIKNSPLLSAILPQASSTPAIVDRTLANQQTLSYVDTITTKRGLNPSQCCAIASGSTSSHGFTIVQGPPGTGKTRTILSMVNVLHVDQYQRYYNGMLASLKKLTGAFTEAKAAEAAVANGASTCSKPALIVSSETVASKSARAKSLAPDSVLGSMAGAFNATLASVYEGRGPTTGRDAEGANGSSIRGHGWSRANLRGMLGGAKRPRLLVCAPSNAAVDELLTRLIASKFIDGNGGVYTPAIARIGAGAKISKSARTFTAENQAEDFLLRFTGEGQSGPPSGFASAAASVPVDYKAAQAEYLAVWQNHCNGLLAQLEHTPKDAANRPRVVAIHEDLERQLRDLRRLRIAVAGELDVAVSRDVRIRKLARTYVEDAQVVFATLSGSASAILTQPNENGETGALFDTVVMDEGSQATEPSCVVPLTLGASRCFLVGDPQQLPATVLASGASGVAYGQSLLDRLCRSGANVLLLDTQYRMHPAISSFPRRYFYGGRLQDAESVQDEHRGKPFHQDRLSPRFGPYVFMNVAHGQERRGGEDMSIFNSHEAELAVSIYKRLKKDYPSDPLFGPEAKTHGSSIGFGVVTPYKRQLIELKRAFDRAGIPSSCCHIQLCAYSRWAERYRVCPGRQANERRPNTCSVIVDSTWGCGCPCRRITRLGRACW